MLPAKRTVVLDAMKAACQDLYDLDFPKVKPRLPASVHERDWCRTTARIWMP